MCTEDILETELFENDGRHDNQVNPMPEFSSRQKIQNDQWLYCVSKFFRRSIDGKHLQTLLGLLRKKGLVEIHFLELLKNNCGEERETTLLLSTTTLEDRKPNESIV